MEDWLEVEDKTVQDALTRATVQLGLPSDQIEYEVLEEEKTGLLGLFPKPAKIRVRRKGAASAQPKVEKEAPVVEEKAEACHRSLVAKRIHRLFSYPLIKNLTEVPSALLSSLLANLV